MDSPPSPNRASPNPSPLPAPGFLLSIPPPALGLEAPERLDVSLGSSDERSSGLSEASVGSGAGLGEAESSRGVFRPPARVRPSSTPISEPASRVSKTRSGLLGGERTQKAIARRIAPWTTREGPHPRRFSRENQGGSGPSSAGPATRRDGL